MFVEESAVSAERLGGDREVDGLPQRVRRRPYLRLRRRPVAEGEEADFFHSLHCIWSAPISAIKLWIVPFSFWTELGSFL